MKVGIKNQIKKTVVEELTAKVMGSGRLDVFATPAMVAMMEEAAHTSVEAELEEGQGTVGTSMTVSHIAATPVGMEVTCESELVDVDGRKLVFEIKAMDEVGLIGEARHERFIIENEKFLAKTNAKLK
jgi:thioesterase superfamily protein